MPVSEIVCGLLGALSARVSFPALAHPVVGGNFTVIVQLAPVATTVNVAVCPAVTVWLAGCVVIDGATAAALTVSVAALLVTLPAELLTTTVNCAPLSELVVAGVV